MPSKPRKALVSRGESLHAHTPSLKQHSNQQKPNPINRKHVKEPISPVNSATSGSEDDEPTAPSKAKAKATRVPPASIIASYLINAQTYLGLQRIHNDSKATLEGFWGCKAFFEESAANLAKAITKRNVEAVLVSAIAIISCKSMKPADYIKADVLEPKSWHDVESIVHYLATSGSKAIRVDFAMKYDAKPLNEEFMDEDDMDSDAENAVASVKQGHRVCQVVILC